MNFRIKVHTISIGLDNVPRAEVQVFTYALSVEKTRLYPVMARHSNTSKPREQELGG
jgi:hypothetical protein